MILARRFSSIVTSGNFPRFKKHCSLVRIGSILLSPVTLSMTVERRTRGRASSRSSSHSSGLMTLCRWNARGYQLTGSIQYPRRRSPEGSSLSGTPEPAGRWVAGFAAGFAEEEPEELSYVSPFHPIRRSSERSSETPPPPNRRAEARRGNAARHATSASRPRGRRGGDERGRDRRRDDAEAIGEEATRGERGDE